MDRRDFLRMMAGASVLAGLPTGCTMMTRGKVMKIDGLGMPPLNTTLMGVLKGALDYHGIDTSTPTVFGVSGHAFLINIHEQLCPSGPYCWNRSRASLLIENLGLQMTDLGFFSSQNSQEDRAAVEWKLRDALDKGTPCSLNNLEHQTITGYDDKGFFTAQPWPVNPDFPPARLSFGSWKEYGNEFHVNFYTLTKGSRADRRTAILDSLDYAVDLHRNPSKHSLSKYGIGPDAYTNWISAAPEHGSSHGNWWNATVWSECRKMASAYFSEIRQADVRLSDSALELEKAYAGIAEALNKLSDKGMPTEEKLVLLKRTKTEEENAMNMVAAFAAAMRS